MTFVQRVATLLAVAALGMAGGCAEKAGISGGQNEPQERAQPAVVPDYQVRQERLAWFCQARFGMFIHYNMFSLWRDEHYRDIESNPDKYTPAEFDERRAARLNLDADAVRDWVQTAKAAGMKYCVLTTKHNDGFCLWDSKVTDFNSVRLGPRRDIVAEFVRQCRDAGMQVGFYYALNDRYSAKVRDAGSSSEIARRQIVAYTKGLLRELMTQYGQVDMLWYDEPFPMGYNGEWDGPEINAMVRSLQPGILINNRLMSAEDFNCSEAAIHPSTYFDEDWEACMTFNGTWAHHPTASEKYRTPRDVIGMLRECTALTGNLLLNIGPDPYAGRMQDIEKQTLLTVGQWLAIHGEAVYGDVDRIEAMKKVTNDAGGQWTRKGNVAYLWLPNWPTCGKVVLKNVHTELVAASVLTDGTKLTVESDLPPDTGSPRPGSRVVLSGLPTQSPDSLCGYAILKLQFASYPR